LVGHFFYQDLLILRGEKETVKQLMGDLLKVEKIVYFCPLVSQGGLVLLHNFRRMRQGIGNITLPENPYFSFGEYIVRLHLFCIEKYKKTGHQKDGILFKKAMFCIMV